MEKLRVLRHARGFPISASHLQQKNSKLLGEPLQQKMEWTQPIQGDLGAFKQKVTKKDVQ